MCTEVCLFKTQCFGMQLRRSNTSIFQNLIEIDLYRLKEFLCLLGLCDWEKLQQVNGFQDPSEFATTVWVNLGLDYQNCITVLTWLCSCWTWKGLGWGQSQVAFGNTAGLWVLHPAWERGIVLSERQKTWNFFGKVLENTIAEKWWVSSL